jgi:hypothetical protein
VIWLNCLSVDSVPVIWHNCLYGEGHASDLVELPVPVIWQNCLYVDSVPVIWQNCLSVDSAVPMIWQNCLWRSVPVIWQNCLYVGKPKVGVSTPKDWGLHTLRLGSPHPKVGVSTPAGSFLAGYCSLLAG